MAMKNNVVFNVTLKQKNDVINEVVLQLLSLMNVVCIFFIFNLSFLHAVLKKHGIVFILVSAASKFIIVLYF